MTTISRKKKILDLLVDSKKDPNIVSSSVTSEKKTQELSKEELFDFLNRINPTSLEWEFVEDYLSDKFINIPLNIQPFAYINFNNINRKYLEYLHEHKYIFGEYMLNFNATNPFFKYQMYYYGLFISLIGTILLTTMLWTVALAYNFVVLLYTYFKTGYAHKWYYWVLGLGPFTPGFVVLQITNMAEHYKYMALADKRNKKK